MTPLKHLCMWLARLALTRLFAHPADQREFGDNGLSLSLSAFLKSWCASSLWIFGDGCRTELQLPVPQTLRTRPGTWSRLVTLLSTDFSFSAGTVRNDAKAISVNSPLMLRSALQHVEI